LNSANVSGTSQVLTANSQTGTTTYTLEAINGANDFVSDSVIVNVENNPTFTNFTVNGQNTISVSPNDSLNFVGTNNVVSLVVKKYRNKNSNKYTNRKKLKVYPLSLNSFI